MFCSKCGNEIKEGARFCIKCGAPVRDRTVAEQRQQPEKTVREQVVQEPLQTVGKTVSKPVQSKFLTSHFHKGLALGVVGLVMAGGVIAAVVFHNKGTEDNALGNESSIVAEERDNTEETTTQKVAKQMDMSAYQSKLDQWKETFGMYTLNEKMQADYNQSIADYQNAITTFDEETCVQCDSVLEALLLQVKQEVFRVAAIRNYYAGTLTGISYDYPEESEYDNQYAIVDVDADGKEELMVSIVNTDMAGMKEVVYEYDPDTDTLNEEFMEFPSNHYYDNGTVASYLSHVQGYSIREDLHPYTVYVYDKDSDTYMEESSMEAWEREFNTEEFPDDADKDGDGVVFSLDGNEEYCDNAEYQAWQETYFGGAKEISIPWKKIGDAEYRSYTDEYIALVIQNVKDSHKIAGTDMGVCYMEHSDDWKYGGDLEAVESLMSSKVDLISSEYEGVSKEGQYNGKTVFYSNTEDAGSIKYCDEKIEDVTLLGLYPGMPEEEGIALLKEYGFYELSEESYHTGDGFGNYAVYLHFEDGVIQSITLCPHSAYAG